MDNALDFNYTKARDFWPNRQVALKFEALK
jgi:hypothetical protein